MSTNQTTFNEIEIKMLQSKGLSEEHIQELSKLCSLYDLKLSDLHIFVDTEQYDNKTYKRLYYVIDYHFYISKALENGLIGIKFVEDNDKVTVYLKRKGFGTFMYSVRLDEVNSKSYASKYVLAKKKAISNGLKILFADVLRVYNNISKYPKGVKKDKISAAEVFYSKDNTKQIHQNKQQTQQLLSTNQSKQQPQPVSSTQVQSTQNNTQGSQLDPIQAIRKKIIILRNKNGIPEDQFNEIVKNAKVFLFDSDKYEMKTEEEYTSLYNYLVEYLSSEKQKV